MVLYARLNVAGELIETREFTEVTGFPVDIPHKDILWRKVEIDKDPEVREPLNFKITSSLVVKRGRVTLAKQLEPIDPEEARTHRISWITKEYRDRIVDALPDLEAVAVLAAERDDLITRLHHATTPSEVWAVGEDAKG